MHIKCSFQIVETLPPVIAELIKDYENKYNFNNREVGTALK